MNKYLFLLAILLSSCMTEGPIKNTFDTFVPKNIYDGWEISNPSEEGIDSNQLAQIYKDFHNDNDLWMVRSLLVFRNNKLIAESYTRNPDDIITRRGFWSCTKQVTGVLIGIAIDKGIIQSIDDSIGKYIPEIIKKYPDKGKITIKQLLTMSSGLNFKNYGWSSDDSQILQRIPNSFLEYSLQKEFVNQPGEKFDYKDSDPTILAAVIQNIVKKPFDEWANEVLFSKIGLNNIGWERYKDGYTIGSFGILSTPREMVKISQLVLNGGKWNNEQIISKEWLETMISPIMDADDKRFGYLWWSYPEHNTYFMAGNGRQLIFNFPEKNLIVAITSEPKNQGKFQLSTPNGRYYGKRISDICN